MDLNTAVHSKHSEPKVSSYLWVSVWGPDSEGHENITNNKRFLKANNKISLKIKHRCFWECTPLHCSPDSEHTLSTETVSTPGNITIISRFKIVIRETRLATILRGLRSE